MLPIVTEQPIAVSIARAATLTSLSKSTIKANIRSGKLQARKIGRRVVITFDELTRFLSDSNHE